MKSKKNSKKQKTVKHILLPASYAETEMMRKELFFYKWRCKCAVGFMKKMLQAIHDREGVYLRNKQYLMQLDRINHHDIDEEIKFMEGGEA